MFLLYLHKSHDFTFKDYLLTLPCLFTKAYKPKWASLSAFLSEVEAFSSVYHDIFI